MSAVLKHAYAVLEHVIAVLDDAYALLEYSYATCSTLINFLSFAQVSLIRKKMSALTLSLPFLICECTPDHHSSKKSALFFQSFFSKLNFVI